MSKIEKKDRHCQLESIVALLRPYYPDLKLSRWYLVAGWMLKFWDYDIVIHALPRIDFSRWEERRRYQELFPFLRKWIGILSAEIRSDLDRRAHAPAARTGARTSDYEARVQASIDRARRFYRVLEGRLPDPEVQEQMDIIQRNFQRWGIPLDDDPVSAP